MACVLFAVLPCATALGIPLASVGTATGSYIVQASYIQVCTMARARAAAVGPICTLAVAWSTLVFHLTTGGWAVAAGGPGAAGPPPGPHGAPPGALRAPTHTPPPTPAPACPGPKAGA